MSECFTLLICSVSLWWDVIILFPWCALNWVTEGPWPRRACVPEAKATVEFRHSSPRVKSSKPCLVSKVPNITGMLASACTELLPEEPDASLPLHDLHCLLRMVLFEAGVHKISAWELEGAWIGRNLEHIQHDVNSSFPKWLTDFA